MKAARAIVASHIWHLRPARCAPFWQSGSRPISTKSSARLVENKIWSAAPQTKLRRGFFTSRRQKQKTNVTVPAIIAIGAILIWSLYPSDAFSSVRPLEKRLRIRKDGTSFDEDEEREKATKDADQSPAWFNFSTGFQKWTIISDVEWSTVSDKFVDMIVPEWSKLVPGYLRKLQREMSMAPGSLADEIWQEAHDPLINPEIQYSAQVRVSDDLCDEEKQFLARRKKVAKVALARYLGLKEKDVHDDDVPVIAICGSGGGLRALVAGTGSLLATAEDGLFDCITYTAGVSGSCWLQTLYNSSFTGGRLDKVLEHLKVRLGVHIAYPPTAFSSLVSAPTNKYLLSGVVEKLKGDPKADFGIVDVFGILLAARLLVPKGELGVCDRDFKLSNQRQYIKYGQNPMPIYTAVRHEIPELDISAPKETGSASEAAKEQAKKESWFQWFEFTPYEFFCEEFTAGIPMWALGRRFNDGVDVPPEDGFHLPEVRVPLLMGIFGSAFCATLRHYYREVQPLIQGMTGLGALDQLISGHNEDLSLVHPIDPATVPNFAYKMDGKLPSTTPPSIYNNEYIQLMDAGMSNNLPIYPLLRPGRNVEVIISFDASADVKTDNWLSVADGYARQRGIKGWPVGVGWPQSTASPKETAAQLDEAQASSTVEAEAKLKEAKVGQAVRRIQSGAEKGAVDGEKKFKNGNEESGELGYCTVWVGTTQERTSEPPPPSKAIDDTTTWQLMEEDAGLAVIYLPFLANEKVKGVDPATSDYMSTWNFIYTPEEIEKVVALARANFEEGRERIKATVRAVYERKKKIRIANEKKIKRDRYRRLVRLGINDKLGEGDHFS
ncbi:putative cytosolic phospholipase a2 zeta protein [Phaeoacremonium minimum UCRPA7]|uniref:Lysophospholipase n=1 Tax=Phaeoacremonium minimum (strain UCR-PA7) TaxID=1286976 RepID=R8BWY4_PHAM7|nr:putative cytosolic phospholipase a2 zeta protein [Phaeoacremonium minimum UCRPA7]EOO03814.1 putative cytosolic phospholipase a2 zeta protein [Phaeoacremonium minimum UCRPA7]